MIPPKCETTTASCSDEALEPPPRGPWLRNDRPVARTTVNARCFTCCLPPLSSALWIARLPTRSKQAGAARPFVFCPEHGNGHLRRVRIRRHAVLEQVFGRFLDLHVAGERRNDRLVDALRLHLVDDFDDEDREHHRRRDDRVPVAQGDRV